LDVVPPLERRLERMAPDRMDRMDRMDPNRPTAAIESKDEFKDTGEGVTAGARHVPVRVLIHRGLVVAVGGQAVPRPSRPLGGESLS